MGLSIGQGLAQFGENVRQRKREERQNKRQASQDLLKASQQEFMNDIRTKELALREKEFNFNQKAKQAQALQEAEDAENESLGMEAYENISNTIRSNRGTKVTGQTNVALSGGGQERIDIPSNLDAFKSIDNPTPEITQFIGDMEKAQKLGASSIASPDELFQGVASEEDRQSLFNAIDSIPIEQHTDLSANIGGILSQQDETGAGITTQTAPATPQEQMQTLQQAFLANPNIKHAPQAMRNELNQLAEKSIIDASEGQRQQLEDAQALQDYNSGQLELEEKQREADEFASQLNPNADRDFIIGEMPAFPELSNTVADAGTKEEFKNFMIEARGAQNQISNAERILEISDKLVDEGWFGSLGQMEQIQLQAEMNSIRSQMTGQNRVPITGPGVLTKVDMDMINDVLGAFDNVWANKILPAEYNVFHKVNRSKLSGFKDRMVKDVVKGHKRFKPRKLKTAEGDKGSVSNRFTVKTVQGS